jgi:hypothetical protein
MAAISPVVVVQARTDLAFADLAVTSGAIGQEEALAKPQTTEVIDVRIDPGLQNLSTPGVLRPVGGESARLIALPSTVVRSSSEVGGAGSGSGFSA